MVDFSKITQDDITLLGEDGFWAQEDVSGITIYRSNDPRIKITIATVGAWNGSIMVHGFPTAYEMVNVMAFVKKMLV